MPNFTINGQLAAAVAVLVDAVFGVLYALNVIHVRPDQSIIAVAVGVAFNLAAYVLAYIQNKQHIVVLQIAHNERMAGMRNGPTSARR